MKSLLKKDLYLLKSSKMNMVIILMFIGVAFCVGLNEKHNITTMVFVFAIIYMMFSLSYNSLYYDSNTDFNKYINFLPVTKRDYIKSKFYFAIVFYLIETVIGLLLMRFIFKQLNTDLVLKLISVQIISGGLIIYEYFKKGGMEDVTRIIKIIFWCVFLLMLLFAKFEDRLNLTGNISPRASSIILYAVSIAVYFIFMKITVNKEEKR